MIFQNKTAKKLFLAWRTERQINFLKYSWNESFFFWIKKKMSGGLNGAALSAYTNFLCDFDTLVKKKNVDWAKHRQHNSQSIFILLLPRNLFERWKIVSDLFTPCGWPKCAKPKMSAEKLAFNLSFCAFWIYRARLSNVLIICRARKAIFFSQCVNSKCG